MRKALTDAERLTNAQIHVYRAVALLQLLSGTLGSGGSDYDMPQIIDAQTNAALDQLLAAQKELYE